jgi:hypothetical protein
MSNGIREGRMCASKAVRDEAMDAAEDEGGLRSSNGVCSVVRSVVDAVGIRMGDMGGLAGSRRSRRKYENSVICV